MKAKSIYVRNVPDEIYRKFRSQAALDGKSVPEAAIELFEQYGKGNDRR